MTLINAQEASLLCEQCQSITDPKRILILYSLNERPHNVSELAAHLDLPQSTVSRHLRKLLNCGAVTSVREGPAVVYSLADSRLIEVMDIMRGVMLESLQRRAQLVDAFS